MEYYDESTCITRFKLDDFLFGQKKVCFYFIQKNGSIRIIFDFKEVFLLSNNLLYCNSPSYLNFLGCI